MGFPSHPFCKSKPNLERFSKLWKLLLPLLMVMMAEADRPAVGMPGIFSQPVFERQAYMARSLALMTSLPLSSHRGL